MPDLDVRDLVVEYESAGYTVRALDGVNIHATDGELVLLLGPSGSGKTTLLSCLAGILRPTSGTISVGSTSVPSLSGRALTEYRRRSVGVVFQAFNLVASLTAAENVDAPLRAGGVNGKDAKRRAALLLELVGLTDRAHHRPGNLSGGQQQRVAIARALAFDPALVLADEPTAHLDYTQVDVVLRILRDLARPGRLVVVSTHDDRITPLADRVIDLSRAPEEKRRSGKVKLARGELLFEEGTRGRLIYIVEKGEIEIVRRRRDGSEEVLATYGPKEYFGELGPLLGFPRAANARARRDSVVAGYSVTQFRERVGAAQISKLLGREPRRRRSKASR